MNKTIISILAMILYSGIIIAQENHSCGYDLLIQQKAENYPEFAGDYLNFFKFCESEHKKSHRSGSVYQIPVVFHVVYNTDEQNLPDSVIYDQLQILNQDYRRLNPNASETREEFLPVAADAEIQFYLAGEDPDGNSTDGIDRVFTDLSGFEFNILDIASLDAVKHSETGGADAWNTENYLNIWICNIQPGFFGGLSGYAYPPNNSPNWPEEQGAPTPGDEGVVLHYPVVGSNNPHAGDDGFDVNDGGRTCTHEVGHYLGLRHIWGDPIIFVEDGCDVDDGIEDTPNVAQQANFVCDYSLMSCETGEDALPAMIENYMDYSTDDCMNMFTMEQISMMRFIIEEYRPELIEGTVIASIPENELNNIQVFPNPAENDLNVLLNNNSLNSYSYSLRDISGKSVIQGSETGSSFTLNVQDIQSGVYLLILESMDEMICRRIVIN